MWELVEVGRVKKASRESNIKRYGIQGAIRGWGRTEGWSPGGCWMEFEAGAVWTTFLFPQIYMTMS